MRGDVRTYNIVVIPGDHIGPELTVASKAVLEAAQNPEGGFRRYLKTCIAGAAHYAKNGTAMTPEGIEAGLLVSIFRSRPDLYANVQPIKLYPNAPTPLYSYKPGGDRLCHRP
jgi:isocitrate/isopropylmalate dehydrogenase